MEPIISPWTIYLVHIVDIIKNFLSGLLTIGLVFLVPMAIMFLSRRGLPKIAFFCFFATYIILVIITALIPSKEVLLAMLIANELSPDKLAEQMNLIMQAASAMAK